MTTSSTKTTAQAHGRYIRGSASKVRRVLDQIRGRTYRDALIMLEFMPYRSTEPITKYCDQLLRMQKTILVLNLLRW